MKTFSLKVLGCAALSFALLTVASAQTPDDGQPQMATPPDMGVPPPDVAPPGGNDAQPNTAVVPVPAEMLDTNGNAMMTQPGEANGQPPQMGQPGQQPGQQMTPNQYQGRGGYDRGGRDRNNRRGYGQQREGGGDTTAYRPPANASTNGTDGIYLNFHGAPIDEVLNYLSDAAGFIIELDTRVSGTVDVFSAHPVSKDEAVDLLNSVLNRNGYAAIRNGRTLRIMSHEDAIHSEIPVKVSNDPNDIPSNDEVVTQIIPIRFVTARQLITDLSPLTSSRATIIANDAGNSIIVTDTQANIRHLVEIIKAIDSSAEDVTEVKVFHLQYHDPVEVANLLTQVFADNSQGQNQQTTPIRFGGGPFARFFGGGGGGGGRFGGGGQQNNDQNNRIRSRPRVVAVADQRTGSVLVTASKDMMQEIEELIGQVDQQSPKVAHVTVVHLENSDPQQMQKVLQDFEASNNRSSSQSSQNSILMQRQNQSLNGSSSSTGFGTSGSGFGTGSGFGGGGGGGFGGGGVGGRAGGFGQ